MRKIFSLLGFCVCLSVSIYADFLKPGMIYYFDTVTGIEFKESGKCMLFNYDAYPLQDKKYDEVEFSYYLESQDGVHFLTLKNEIKEEKYLVLYNNDLLILYADGQSNPYKIGYRDFNIMESFEMIPEEKKIKVSSSLVEGSDNYCANNLRNLNLDQPWVEGVPDSGVGESIYIANWTSQTLVIFSGFVSYSRPNLYKNNARPKRIKITLLNSKESYFYDLIDSPNPQNIKMPKGKGDIMITIVEVYEGTKYKDLCVNAIACQ